MNERLSALANAAEDLRDRLSAAAIARILGHSTSTITRRTGPMLTWSAAEVFSLALGDDDFGRAICQTIGEKQRQRNGDASKVGPDLIAEVQASHALHEHIVTSMADGRITPTESATLRQMILQRHALDAILLRDLKALGDPHV